MTGNGMQTINESLRLRHVYSTLVDFGASGLVDRTPLGGTRRALQRWIYRVPGPIPALPAAVRTRVLIEQLGPTYVKLGQIVSSQAAVLPDDWREQLDLLQNEVPPAPYEGIRSVIVAELGAPPEELYASFDQRPLAAASLAQVHRAVLHDGTQVAVKVQRPNLQRQVRSDLGIARLFGRYAERRSGWARQVGVAGMLNEFSSTLLEELDYYTEAYNMERLAKNLESIDGVRVPKLYRALSSQRVLTQEFVKGVKISDVSAMRAAGLDVAAIGDAALRAAMKMLLIDGFFHGDPHPGNLFVDLDTGDVTFLDCGMVGELSVAKRAHLVALLWSFTRDDMAGMGQQLRALSVPFREVRDDNFAHDFERKMSRYPKGGHGDVQRVLSGAMDVLRDNGLRLDPQLTLALKAMAQSSAFFTPLAPADRPFSTAALDSVKDLAKDTFTEEYVVEVGKKEANKVLARVLQEAPDYLRGLLSVSEQLKRGKISLYLDTSSLDRQVNRLRAISVVIVLALLLAGALIGSSIATGVLSQPGSNEPVAAQWAQYAFFGSVVLSAVLIVVFLARMVSDMRREHRDGADRR